MKNAVKPIAHADALRIVVMREHLILIESDTQEAHRKSAEPESRQSLAFEVSAPECRLAGRGTEMPTKLGCYPAPKPRAPRRQTRYPDPSSVRRDEMTANDGEAGDAYQFEFAALDGGSLKLESWRGHPVLVV